ncbi:GH116 family glycosyl hydrolase [Paenibacillus koleovorans]|uniref:GH116 family glycosyl hydrolase n=1 Tax=Paenibacillus koleovorans TaxID=121608 RepID=UPI000FDBE711|nr:GH116 family glycosyl hydrolase [Paenibacillus koleovorans]
MSRTYNTAYSGDRNSHTAFPLGGIGAGMFCLEGTGALSHFSLRHRPDINHEPTVFSAIHIKGRDGAISRVLEGQVPTWKIFSDHNDNLNGPGCGLLGKHYGLPRFAESEFLARFPFGTVSLRDPKLPIEAEATGWSPFIPLQADDSSLPVCGLEFTFANTTAEPLELVYSFHASNFMKTTGSTTHRVLRSEQGNGFILHQPAIEDKPWELGSFCATTDHPDAKVDCAWFRGGWFDSLTMVWSSIEAGLCVENAPVHEYKPSPGGSIYIPLKLESHGKQTVRLLFSWFVPESNLTVAVQDKENVSYHKPWYAGVFDGITGLTSHWLGEYGRLREESARFRDTFYGTTLPPETIEAIAANLTILKSPTVLRQTDGRLWAWEGSNEKYGSCHGSCTHVWNYAQATPHLFPELERSLRHTEFHEGQDEYGHQNFRVPLPISPADHKFHVASDGQLGGVMKLYREWRISGDTDWLLSIWPKVKLSLQYCMDHFDPDRIGVLIEPHHNTYDIEFWGPDGMCTSFYLGALRAAARMAEAAGEAAEPYDSLFEKGKAYMERELFNGEYFEQRIIWEGLRSPSPVDCEQSWNVDYSPEAADLLQKEGPKYQYGKGCLSDGVVGAWLAQMCGLGDILEREMVRSHLLSVYKYNLKRDLSEHVNPQRPGYAIGGEGGLLLCSWPKGGKLSLPFVYSNEVWTGIEYQVASHLMALGCTLEGLDIVRTCRDRYNNGIRNPFDEYECGHWYARALASYGLLQGYSGIRYDACEKTLYVQPQVDGDYASFLCTSTGYGLAGMRDGKPFAKAHAGHFDIKHTLLLA